MAIDAKGHDQLASAYDAIASVYDGHVLRTNWMRSELRRHYLRLFRPGDQVLDVGCGTGTEAVFLAAQGVHVTAMDASPGMIQETKRKVAALCLERAVETHVADFANLGGWAPERFHGILSTFAALNMVNSLRSFSACAARLLVPGGRMLLHLSNRFSVQELASLACRGHWGAAHRLPAEGVRYFTMAGRRMVIHLSSPDETYRWFFEPEFELVEAYALGVVRPYSDPPWLPEVALSALGGIERRVRGRRPLVRWGRFFVLDLAKRGQSGPGAGRM